MLVVEFAVPPMQARLNHILICYIQQVSLQTLLPYETVEPAGATVPDPQL